MKTSELTNIKVDGIDMSDYPDFCDAFICSAEHNGIELSDNELDELNKNTDFVYECVMKELF